MIDEKYEKQRKQIEQRLKKHKEWLKDEFDECVERAVKMADKWDRKGKEEK